MPDAPVPPPPATWRAAQEERARLLHTHIAGLQQLIGAAPTLRHASSADPAALLRTACAPYYAMLEQIYRDDMPLADTLDSAAFVARMDGPAVATPSLPLAVVTTLLTEMQAQLGAMVRTVAAGIYPALEWPRDLEFRLSSFARGSLYLGFELPQPPDGAVFMRGDPFEQSARESLTALGAASRLVATEVPFAQVLGEMPDPRLRDAALAAVERLSPTGRRGIASLSLAGRCFGDQAWRRLTPETRQRARALIESTAPAATCQPIILQGVVRQIDLDQRRFDLRTPAPTSSPGSATASPQAAPLIRCRYGAELDRTLKTLLDSTVEVQGDAEMYDGKPRLVQVRSVRPVA